MLGVAVLGAVVRTRQAGGASLQTALDNAFVVAGAVTLLAALCTGLWLVRSVSRDATPASDGGSRDPLEPVAVAGHAGAVADPATGRAVP
ncbi:hypothetical protein [Nocardia neocaledoniensis]|uniref:hypothetical protein n=1 Tax=Nocardia neocaledoniensis TaxID=236511 RepID=UPI002455D691|nr:hypothetical protein [Nocardia neocaledoniensis]